MKVTTFIKIAPDAEGEGNDFSKEHLESLSSILGKPFNPKLFRAVSILGFKPTGSFPLRPARVAAKYIKLTDYNVAIGRQAIAALGYRTVEPLKWFQADNLWYAMLPNLNPRNPWWTKTPNAVAAVESFLLGLIEADRKRKLELYQERQKKRA